MKPRSSYHILSPGGRFFIELAIQATSRIPEFLSFHNRSSCGNNCAYYPLFTQSPVSQTSYRNVPLVPQSVRLFLVLPECEHHSTYCTTFSQRASWSTPGKIHPIDRVVRANTFMYKTFHSQRHNQKIYHSGGRRTRKSSRSLFGHLHQYLLKLFVSFLCPVKFAKEPAGGLGDGLKFLRYERRNLIQLRTNSQSER